MNAHRIYRTKYFTTLAMLVVAIVMGHQGSILAEPPDTDQRPLRTYPDDLSRAFRAAAEDISPSVVAIEALHGARRTEEWSRSKGLREQKPPESAISGNLAASHADSDEDRSGSGLVLDGSGIILTNFHIVEDADAVIVRLPDGEEYPAQNVWGDGVSDLAIIRIVPGTRLRAATLGDSDKLQIGEWVVAIGNPFGLDRSISAGIISAMDRKMQHNGATLIQTDAASNPGNSGGPLVNLEGQVVGILEGAGGARGESQGVNFAIPINVVKRVARELLRTGRMTWPALGIDSQQLTPSVAKAMGIGPDQTGVLLTDVAAGTSAERAGLKPGDVITHFAGHPLESPAQFQKLLDQTPAGVVSQVRLIRSGQPLAKGVELEPHSIPLRTKAVSVQEQLAPEGDPFGMTVSDIGQSPELGYPDHATGALVTSVRPQSPAYYGGIRAGMIVRRVGDVEVSGSQDYQAVTAVRAGDKTVLMLIGAPYGSRFMMLTR